MFLNRDDNVTLSHRERERERDYYYNRERERDITTEILQQMKKNCAVK